VHIEDYSDELQMELLELQANDKVEAKFYLSPNAFPPLSREIRAILAMFGSTYRCEQLFSKMKHTKSHLRSQLTNQHLNDECYCYNLLPWSLQWRIFFKNKDIYHIKFCH